MRRISSILLASAIWAANADADAMNCVPPVTVYRLELRRDASGGETAYIVGGDGVPRHVEIVDPDEYARLKEIAAKYAPRKRVVRTAVDAARREKTTTFDDGTTQTERMTPKKPSNISDRQWQMRRQREAAKTRPPRTVTLEHDPMTGKDTVR